MPDYKHKATCHTTCYKFETMWQPGEVYEGDQDPGKHFSPDGVKDPSAPPPDAGSDPRSNKEIRNILQRKYNSTKPKSWNRKKLWAALQEFEMAEGQDEATNPSNDIFIARCGFEAKSKAGLTAHERVCPRCKGE